MWSILLHGLPVVQNVLQYTNDDLYHLDLFEADLRGERFRVLDVGSTVLQPCKRVHSRG
jgi:hypothetical protein